MKVVDKMAEKVRNGLRSFLQIEPAQKNTFTINEMLDFEGNAAKNRIWYRGEAEELSQLYKNLPGEENKNSFWAAVPSIGRDIRKIHTGLPSIIVDTLVNIVLRDMNGIGLEGKYQKDWESIAKDNMIEDIWEEALTETLVVGDGVFKIILDSDLSQFPIIEFVSGEYVEYVYQYGRLKEIVFKQRYTYNSQTYILYETYGMGYIRYELRKNGKEVDITTIPATGNLQNHEYGHKYIMAVPFSVFKSAKWKGRGKSIFDGKTDDFDAFDECWSQWMDALRKGRSKEYIPTDMLPRNPHTGEIMKPNAFDNAYIEHESTMLEGQQKKIELIQPEIPHDSYLCTYVTCLDLCLQGIISPSTIGIDGNKLKDDTATAQKEREKVTLYTRGKIVEAMQNTIPKLVDVIFKVKSTMEEKALEDIDATVEFGEYSSPGFDAVVDTVGKARQNGIMSIESAIEELYGDSKDEEWKQEEIARIKAEQGVAEMEQPQVSDDLAGNDIIEQNKTVSENDI